MSTGFPTSLDAFVNPTSANYLDDANPALDHATQHTNINDAVAALQAKVGINSSAVTTSIDYKLSALTTVVSGKLDTSSALVLGESSSTAYRGDRGKAAYDHSLLTSGNPHAVTKSDVGLGNVDNTSDANKPVSTAQQTALNLKAPLASPTFTGTPAAPTATTGTNTTQIATTAFVAAALAALVNSAPVTLDTLNELAAALGNDPNFATTVATSLGLKAPLASPALTGTPTAPTAAVDTNTTQIATTAFVLGQAYAKLASPALTGTPTAPTASAGTNTTQLATTAFVTAAVAALNAGPRVFSVATATTLTPEVDTYDLFTITALASALNIANHVTSTPQDGKGIRIRILDNGSARALTFGTNYVARGGVALPNTTVAGKFMELGFEWNANLGKYNLLGLALEA